MKTITHRENIESKKMEFNFHEIIMDSMTFIKKCRMHILGNLW